MLLLYAWHMCILYAVSSLPHNNESKIIDLLIPQPNTVDETIDSPLISATASASRSLASSVANTNILTLFKYNGSQIYVYSSASNEGEKPEKWIFYYVPVMAPLQSSLNNPWVWASKNEVRVKLLLGDDAIEEMARKAIVKKYDIETGKYAQFWDIAPLMIDSLTAYIVEGSSSPVAGVEPYRAIHPNSLSMIFRFKCSTEENAQSIAEMIQDGEYEIEISFYFAGFYGASTNFISITGDQLKAAASKTTADGENTNAQYIHRDQASSFIAKYTMNVKKIAYSENSAADTKPLADGLEAQFLSLLQQGNFHYPTNSYNLNFMSFPLSYARFNYADD